MRDNLFIPNKLDYARGKVRPDVACILCAIVEGDDKVERLTVHQTDLFTISLNLYPYSPGHLMIFPKRHVIDPRELRPEEVSELHSLQCLSLDVLNQVYQTQSYNVGYNIGIASGASIDHLHLHIVPRYPKELGFIDVIGGTRVIIEDPVVTQAKLRAAFGNGKRG